MAAVTDPFDLARFVTAQAAIHDIALAELRAGRKRTHWMWFVFPQLRGLGHSAMARHYGITGLAEARAYLAHPLLGPRLAEATQAVLGAIEGRDLHGILGSPDDMKFRSCMTLFAAAAGDAAAPFGTAIARCCGGLADDRTQALLPNPK
ncbi:MAG TPA: DUF1810 domain-containing protein [Roseomonas sp.]|jgi:uncharacterized protein (DUF1810 family)